MIIPQTDPRLTINQTNILPEFENNVTDLINTVIPESYRPKLYTPMIFKKIRKDIPDYSDTKYVAITVITVAMVILAITAIIIYHRRNPLPMNRNTYIPNLEDVKSIEQKDYYYPYKKRYSRCSSF